MGRYTKFFIAIGAFSGVLSAALADGVLSNTEISGLVASATGALLVFVARNDPEPTDEFEV